MLYTEDEQFFVIWILHNTTITNSIILIMTISRLYLKPQALMISYRKFESWKAILAEMQEMAERAAVWNIGDSILTEASYS